MTQPHEFCGRYRAGQHVAVWRELIALGESVRHEPFLSDATWVSKEIVRRAQINLRILHRRLLDLGYEFAEPEAVLKDAGEDAPRRIDEFENEFGTIPVHLFLGGSASNCELKGFSLPCNGVDGVIFNDGGGDTFFVDELRDAFQWGGFPFWEWGLKKSKFYSPMEYRPNFKKLLPQLKEGLLEL